MSQPRLSFKTKLAYGIGELGTVIPVSIAVFFLLFFLTNVAGLSPKLAGAVLLLGRCWDAINDPLIGWLSDRTQSRWGRRYPWMVWGALPLALCCALQWMVPPLQSQIGLFLYYSIVSLVAYAAFSAVLLPFAALAAELTTDYDERTSLMGVKAGFNIAGSVLGLVIAQLVFDGIENEQQQYITVGLLSSVTVIVGLSLCIWGTQQHYWQLNPSHRRHERLPTATPSLSFWAQIPSLLTNRPFRWLMGLYLCSWMGVQITAAMLPYFVTSWMGLPEQHFTQMAIAVQGTAVLTMPVWILITQKTGKKIAYGIGALIALFSLGALSWVQPDQIRLMYGLGIAIGIGLATFYLIPMAMLPDVIDYDALNTGQRREGLYFSFLVFFQKVGLAISLFIIGGLLEETGFITSQNEPVLTQPTLALWTIRLLMGVFPAALIAVGLFCATRYPLNRQYHQQIKTLLDS